MTFCPNLTAYLCNLPPRAKAAKASPVSFGLHPSDYSALRLRRCSPLHAPHLQALLLVNGLQLLADLSDVRRVGQCQIILGLFQGIQDFRFSGLQLCV